MYKDGYKKGPRQLQFYKKVFCTYHLELYLGMVWWCQRRRKDRKYVGASSYKSYFDKTGFVSNYTKTWGGRFPPCPLVQFSVGPGLYYCGQT